MMPYQIETTYRNYITCLNERRLDEAEAFYTDSLFYNGSRISRDEWRKTAIDASFAAMPDLQWHIEQLVIQGDHFAARLTDTATFAQQWHGVEPTGRPSSFGENVFYHLSGGLIDEVWSTVDIIALKQHGRL